MRPRSRSAATIFDYIPPARGIGWQWTIGDVAGQGKFPAALLMARLSAEVRYTLASENSARGSRQSIKPRPQNEHVATIGFVTLLIVGHSPP
jgi:hypothetical protein